VTPLALSALALLGAASAFASRRRAPASLGPPLGAVDPGALVAEANALLDDPARFAPLSDEDGVALARGRTPGCPCPAYRSVVELPAPLDAVVRLLADEMVERLGDWNAQYRGGEVLAVLEDAPVRKAWLVRVVYATPRPLADREYLYVLARQRLADGRVVLAYRSVDDPAHPPRAGLVRAVLHPTAHRCTAIAPGATRLEHVLATDLGGALPVWLQAHVFAGGLAKALAADARAQRSLLQGVSGPR
jgi:hypothetical protein